MRWTWEAVLFITMIISAFGGLAYAWKKWRDDAQKLELPTWRRAVANIGFLAVAGQAVLFLVFWEWPGVGHDYVPLGHWARWILPSFLVALAFRSRWEGSLAMVAPSSSVLLFVICFFIVLSA
jgi:hypothetical protein